MLDLRTRSCGAKCAHADGAAVEVRQLADGPKARYARIHHCNHVWSCPVCASHIRKERSDQIVSAVSAGLYFFPQNKWIMFTPTVRHHRGIPLRKLFLGVQKAWRRTRQNGTVQRIFKRRVAASIRARETTHGAEHGWHPHLHVLINTAEWGETQVGWMCPSHPHTERRKGGKCKHRGCGVPLVPRMRDEKEILLSTWKKMVIAELGVECVPDAEHGLKWSDQITDPHDGAYLAKLGLEMSWGEKRVRGKASRSPWGILRDAVAGDAQSVMLWREYEEATKGARAIELDDRAALLAKVGVAMNDAAPCVHCGRASGEHLLFIGACLAWESDCDAYEPRPEAEPEPTIIPIDGYAVFLLRCLERRMRAVFWLLLRDVEARPDEAQAVVDGWISFAARARTEERSRLYGPD